MSAEAMAWALRVDLTGQLSAEHRLVLVTLADYARPDEGTAWPSQHTMADRLGTSTRSVRRALDRLQALGLIARGDQSYVAHIRSDRRPVVYVLRLGSRARPPTIEPDPLPVDNPGPSVTPEGPRPDSSVPPARPDSSVPPSSPRPDSSGTHDRTAVSAEPTTEPTTTNHLGAQGDHSARGRARPGRYSDGRCLHCETRHPVVDNCPPVGDHVAGMAKVRAALDAAKAAARGEDQ